MTKILTKIFFQKLNLNQLKVDNYLSQKLSQLVDYHYFCILNCDSFFRTNSNFIIYLKAVCQHQF